MNRFQRFILYWPEAWLDLIDALCWIITLGQWKPELGMRYICSATIKRLEKRMGRIKK